MATENISVQYVSSSNERLDRGEGNLQLKDDEKWLENLDLEAFKEDMTQLNKILVKSQGEEDVQHLNKIVLVNKLLTIVGFATCFCYPNPLTILCLSLGTFSRWMIAHHVCHGGYDKTRASNNGYSRFKFALGGLYRRVVDWFDWMLPEAWNAEHNLMHHYHLNEGSDPDLVQRNVENLRKMNIPKSLKYVVVVWFMLTWKWSYYAVNTFSQLEFINYRKSHKFTAQEEKQIQEKATGIFDVILGETPIWFSRQKFLFQCFLPFLLARFVLVPLPFYFFFGPDSFRYAILNLLLAEMLTNFHAFVAIVPNHAGDDMYSFTKPCKPKSAHFYLRQVIGSVNYTTGTDLIDFFHGFLNYQIEHHLFPDLTMLAYRKSQPLTKAICDKHRVPYIQQHVFWRLKKTIDIMVGNSNMRELPQAYY